MPKIKIVLGGQNHHDPAPMSLVINQILGLHQNGAKVSIGREMSKDWTLPFLIEEQRNEVEFGSEIAKLKKLVDLNKGPLTPVQKAKFLKNCNNEGFIHNFDQIQWDIITRTINLNIFFDFPMDQMKLKLYETAAALDIPLFGIEFSEPLRKEMEFEMATAGTADELDAVRAKWEPKRMVEMANNILTEALRFTEEGGTVFITDLGAVHSHRLAVYLLKLLEKSSLPENVEIEIVPMRVVGPPVCELMSEELKVFSEILVESEKHDPKEISECYPYVPCFHLKVAHDITNDLYSCDEFTTLANETETQGFVYPKDYKAMKTALAVKHANELELAEFIDSYTFTCEQVVEVMSDMNAEVELLTSGAIYDVSGKLPQKINYSVKGKDHDLVSFDDENNLIVATIDVPVPPPLLFSPILMSPEVRNSSWDLCLKIGKDAALLIDTSEVELIAYSKKQTT